MITFIILFTFYLIGYGLAFGQFYAHIIEYDELTLYRRKPISIYNVLRYNPEPDNNEYNRTSIIIILILSSLSWLSAIIIAVLDLIQDGEIYDIKFSNEYLIDEYNINNHLIHDNL